MVNNALVISSIWTVVVMLSPQGGTNDTYRLIGALFAIAWFALSIAMTVQEHREQK